MRTALLLPILMVGLVFGCGQRGALYLRESPPPGVRPVKPEAQKSEAVPRSVGERTEPEKKP